MSSLSVWISEKNCALTSFVDEVILYGAGFNAARLIVRLKREHANATFLCIVDSDVNKQGSYMFDIPIVSPESLMEYDSHTYVIVTPSTHCFAITDKLNQLGFFNILYLNSWNAVIMEIASKKNEWINENLEKLDCLLQENDEKISEVRRFLQHDDKSLAVFDAKLESSFKGCHVNLEALAEGGQYFPNGIIALGEHEVFVDCGAFDGGTVLDFIKRAVSYSYIYALEPDPLQYELTKIMLELHRVKSCELFNLGAYDIDGVKQFEMSDLGSSKITQNGDVTVNVASLDALLYNKTKHPSFIKMDIEGAELNALHGAERLIARDMPKLAISVYHGQPNVQLWEVPYWIMTNFVGYSIYFRQHANLNETVCYAVKH